MTAQRGFSLLELLVAFSVLALSLAILMQIFSVSLRTVDVSRGQAQALALAQSLVASAGAERPLSGGQSSGTSGDRYRWFLTATPMSPATPNGPIERFAPEQPTLWEIRVRVTWHDSGGPERDVTLTTLRVDFPDT